VRQFDRRALEELRGILLKRPAAELEVGALRRACVLIPLFEHDGEWSIVFLKRAADMSMHSGQIAFPGGAAEKNEMLEEAALRETEEELGIPRAQVELIGRLDDLVTISGYVVAPFVGIVSARPSYVLQVAEVADAFEVPLSALLDEKNPEIEYVEFRDNRHPVYRYLHGDRVIWGLTGRMVKAFLDLVRLTV
jgi:8-oxo-dGTP pyrophosphatase MutT (NUDIX family)